MTDDRVETGGCFCGAITAEMRGEPFWICFDHDDDCRRAIGGAPWLEIADHLLQEDGYSRTRSPDHGDPADR